MQRIVGGRAHFSDLLNGAIETLIGAHYELPALSTLRRLAGHLHATTTNAWLTRVDERLTDSMRTGLEKLLAVLEGATEPAFAQYLKDRGFPDFAQEYVRDLRERPHRDVLSMEHAAGTDQTVLLRPDGQTITPRPGGIKPPLSAQQLAEAMLEA